MIVAYLVHKDRSLHEKINPEKFSQRLQEMNRYLDFSTGKEKRKNVKAYGKALLEWTVIFLALVKDPWKFRYLNDQLDTYHQQCQYVQQKQIIIKILL
jgi:chromosome condensin MukBEF ATPase and DNA-binding subunit MukB